MSSENICINQGVESFMCSLILFSLYTKYLFKYKNRIIKKRGIDFIKKGAVYKKKVTCISRKICHKSKISGKNRRFLGLATSLMKFPCGDASWTLDPHNSMKIRENPENICTGLWIILHPNTMC